MEKILQLHAEQILANNQLVNVEIDGCVLTDKYTLYKDAILDFEVRDSDVWVCSFPKTGTTWTEEMVWLICNNLDYEGATVRLPDRFVFIEIAAMTNLTPEAVTPDNFLDKLNQMKDRRFIKSHLPWHLLPKQIQNGARKPRIIYITRDPRDACVSYYYHYRLWGRITYELDRFCELFLADKIEYHPFWDHVYAFWHRRSEDNILFLRYEQLQQDLASNIKKVANYLDVQLTNEDVRKLADHLSFAKMKDNTAVNYREYIDLFREKKYTTHKGEFMRSGCSGSYKKSMTPEMIEKFNTWIREKTSGTDFPFYADNFSVNKL